MDKTVMLDDGVKCMADQYMCLQYRKSPDFYLKRWMEFDVHEYHSVTLTERRLNH